MESPIHLALLDAGFAWENNWEFRPEGMDDEVAWVIPGYGPYLGGSLEGFAVSDQIRARVRAFEAEGIEVRRCAAEDFASLVRFDTGRRVHGEPGEEGCDGTIEGSCTYAAFQEGRAVGWLWEVATSSCWAEEGTPRVMGGCVPMVIPQCRNRGIGKVLYHLGMGEVVRQGARYGWTATSVHSPARRIYRSIGYEYWHLAFNMMFRRL